MKKIIFVFLTVLIALPLLSQTDDKRLKGIEKEFEKVLKTLNAPGFGVAIVEKDKVIYSAGFGFSDYENKVKTDENTLFAIGSCSKAFTSSLLGMMEAEGDISLDESPITYIPGFSFINGEMNNSIKIRDLMCHRTGLPRHDFSWYFFPAETKEALLERVKYHEPFTGVREQWYYNNFMFLAQGVITEKVSGKSWEENIEEKIFEPLEMTRSNTTIDELEASDNKAFGYGLDKNKEIEKLDYYRIGTMGPAGSINSSAREMANWLIAWINNGKFGDKEIIPGAYRTQAISSQMVVSAGFPVKDMEDMHFSNYGYGWFLASYKGHYRVEHGGNIDGFSASTSFYPADSIGIVVLANQNGSAVPGLVRNILSDRMLGVKETDWIKVAEEQIAKAEKAAEEARSASSSNKKEGTSPSHKLADYAGTYLNDGYGEIEIELSGDSLYASLPLMKFYLAHFHYDIFELYEVDGTDVSAEVGIEIKFSFESGLDGEISGIETKMEPTTDPIFFKRVPKEVLMEKDALERLCGEYELAGMIAKFYIKNEKLHLFVPGQPEYELLSLGDNKFKLIIVEGFSVEFVEDEDGNVTECKFIQPNGTFAAKRK